MFLVSGGFRAIIDPIAAMLGIPQDHVFANTILFQVLLIVEYHAQQGANQCGKCIQLALSDGLTDSQERLHVQEDGSFAGFDDKELTSQSGGKASAARLIKVS